MLAMLTVFILAGVVGVTVRTGGFVEALGYTLAVVALPEHI